MQAVSPAKPIRLRIFRMNSMFSFANDQRPISKCFSRQIFSPHFLLLSTAKISFIVTVELLQKHVRDTEPREKKLCSRQSLDLCAVARRCIHEPDVQTCCLRRVKEVRREWIHFFNVIHSSALAQRFPFFFCLLWLDCLSRYSNYISPHIFVERDSTPTIFGKGGRIYTHADPSGVEKLFAPESVHSDGRLVMAMER